jgi:hypothetical protein
VKRRRWPYLWVSHGEDKRRARLGRLLALVVGPRVRRLLWLDREHAEEKVKVRGDLFPQWEVFRGEDERRARLGRLLALVVGPRVRAVCGCVGTRGREGVG